MAYWHGYIKIYFQDFSSRIWFPFVPTTKNMVHNRRSANIPLASKSGIKIIHAEDAQINKEAADDRLSKNRNSDTKKMMKKARTMKRISELEDAANFEAHLGDREYVHHHRRHGKVPTPNYMKPTTSSDARKEQLRLQLNRPAKMLTRKSSLRVVRPSPSFAKTTPSPSSPKNKAAAVVIRRSNCSSTLRDSKFPSRIQLRQGSAEHQGTSAVMDRVMVCRYDHCSLNGHVHHRTSPPLKTFISSRRRLLKTQKTTKLRGISSFRKRHSRKHPKHVSAAPPPDEEEEEEEEEASPFTHDMVGEDGGDEIFIKIYNREVEKLMSAQNNKTELDYLDISEAYEDQDSHEDQHRYSSDDGDVSETGSERYFKPDATVDSSEPRVDVLPVQNSESPQVKEEKEKNMIEDQDSFFMGNEEYISEDTNLKAEDYIQEISVEESEDDIKEKPVKESEDDIKETSVEESEYDIKETPVKESEDDIKEASVEESEDDIKEKPVDESESECTELKARTRKKRDEDDEEEALSALREFNPRGPNFLALEADPEAERVDLRHQMTDGRKNSEEWMIDYALRRVVGELAPARNNKVELLVEAFETVAPVDETSPIEQSQSQSQTQTQTQVM